MTDNLPPLQREREAFEAEFPPPSGVTWVVDRYEVSESRLDSYRCDRFVGQWDAWKARTAIDAALAARGAVPAGMVLVNAGALQMVINALRRDASEGRPVRGEMADELFAAPQQVAQPVQPSDTVRFENVDHLTDSERELYRKGVAAGQIAQAKPEQAAQQWMPIETAPKDSRILMGRVGYSWVFSASWDEHRAHWSTGTGPMEFFANPTHWMPLPAAPQKPKD